MGTAKMLATDIMDFEGEQFYDLLSKEWIPTTKLADMSVDFLTGGYSCKDASTLRRGKSSTHVAQPVKGELNGSTSSTCFGFLELQSKLKAKAGMTENTPMILQPTKDGEGKKARTINEHHPKL